MKLKFELNENKNGLIVTDGEDLEGELVIPSEQEYEGKMYPVTEIGYDAFEDDTDITNVVIPNTVMEIGSGAFNGCKSLTSIVIPDSVIEIGEGAFYGCTGLTSIVIPDSVTKIGESTFEECKKLKSIIIPASVKEIGEAAFYFCNNLANIVIPDSVTKIGEMAFACCNDLESIVIPASVKHIGSQVFNGCENLTRIEVAEGNEVYDSREGCNAIIETATNTLIQGCVTTIIPNTVIEIGESAFANCTDMVSVVIPASVTIIGKSAFDGCYNLESVVISDSVKVIKDLAFAYCLSLLKINCPDSLIEFGELVFIGSFGGQYLNSNLSQYLGEDFGDKMSKYYEELYNDVFKNKVTQNQILCDSKEFLSTKLKFKINDTCDGLVVTELEDGVEDVVIPSVLDRGRLYPVTEIGDGAFYYCRSLKNIIIPDSVTRIDAEAFEGCYNLKTITISNASLLKDVDIPKQVKIVKP